MNPPITIFMTIACLFALPSPPTLANPTEDPLENHSSLQGVLKGPAGAPLPDGPHEVRLSLWTAPTSALQSVADEVPIRSSVWDDTDIVHFRLSHGPVVPGSESVRRSDTGATLIRGTDYRIDNTRGIIAILIGLVADTGIQVSYQWAPTRIWSEEKTVTTAGGLFTAQVPLPPVPGDAYIEQDNLYKQNLFLQIEVGRGDSYEALMPRLPLGAAPRAGSIHGATGGVIRGWLHGEGTVSGMASIGTVDGQPVARAGLIGRGAADPSGDAPGIMAIGANKGEGIALAALGPMGIVDAADYTVWRDSLKSSTAPPKLTVGGDIQLTKGGFHFPDGTVQTSAAIPYSAGPGLGVMEHEGIFYYIVAPGGVKTPMLDNDAVTAEKLVADPDSLAKITGGRATTSSSLAIELENVQITSFSDPNTPVSIGQHYKDNGIVAWAKVAPNGTLLAEYGISSITHEAGTGQYAVTLDASAQGAASLVPVVTPVVQGPPTGNSMRYASVQVTGPNALTIYTTSPTFAPAESAFTLIVTGR